jgi:signal transduction histidine kinase
MSTRRRSPTEVERALLHAEEALRARDEFLSIAGHELRSPLTAVQLQTDTLAMLVRQGGSAQAIEERAERVQRSVARLSWLVEEMLDLGRASGAGLRLKLGRADLVAIAHRVVDRLAHDLRRGGWEAAVIESGPVFGSWDSTRVEHALGSLVLAAIKGGGGGRIELALSDDGDGGARALVRGGRGVADEHSALVFASFDAALAGLEPGSPVLGLWLARAVAEAHGGRLSLQDGAAALELPKTGGQSEALIGEDVGTP